MGYLSRILIGLGVAGLIGGLAWGSGDAKRLMSSRAEVSKLNGQIDTTRAALFYENTQYRGYSASLKTMPDSIRISQRFILQRRGGDIRKRVIVLERSESNLVRLRKLNKRRAADAKTRLMSRGLSVTGGGLLLLLVGLALRHRSLSR